VTRILFVEGKDEAALRSFAGRLATPWRLLARPEQGLFLLEAADPGEEAERAAGGLPGARAWAFDVVAEGPSD
jgi:hypothetical protein